MTPERLAQLKAIRPTTPIDPDDPPLAIIQELIAAVEEEQAESARMASLGYEKNIIAEDLRAALHEVRTARMYLAGRDSDE